MLFNDGSTAEPQRSNTYQLNNSITQVTQATQVTQVTQVTQATQVTQ
jgi:hypothetical protein